MSNQAINTALSLRLQALGLPTYFENQPGFAPTAGVLYLAEAYLPGDTTQVGMEDGSSDDYKGLYQVTVMAPRDVYKAAGFAAAKSIALHFRRGTWLDEYGASVTAPDRAGIVRCVRVTQESARLVGDRWAIPVSIYYRALLK